MSLRALIYARSIVRQKDCPLTSNERHVFRAIADSCNTHTGLAFSGTWIADETGLNMRTVRNALHRLRADGFIKLEERHATAHPVGHSCHGCMSSIVTFPTASYISTAPVTGDRGERLSAPVTSGRGPLAPVTEISGSTTPDVRELSNNLESSREGAAWCCDGTGFVYDEHTRSSAPCPVHHPRGKALRS